MKKTRPLNFLAGALLLLTGALAQALETDQFYAWGKPIDDSTVYLNAWVHLQIEQALDSGADDPPRDCEAAADRIQRRLQHTIFQPIEVWINSTQLVDRIPRGAEENHDYRESYLLSKTLPIDFARQLPPSPTVEVNGIRLGADKLAHFFSEGWWYYGWWKRNRNEFGAEAVQNTLLANGVEIERWVQGYLLTGIISPADMEANYQGFIFYQRLCHGDRPLLSHAQGRWTYSGGFDISSYVSPDWDESWNPNIYSPRRWKNIRKTMRGYCPQLRSTWVKEQRAHYAALDRPGPLENLLRQKAAAGELPDPHQFDVTSVCSAPD